MLSNPPAFPETEPVNVLPEKQFPADAVIYEQNLKRTKCDLITANNIPDMVN